MFLDTVIETFDVYKVGMFWQIFVGNLFIIV